ncbi:tyrosine-protein phosphatase [Glutamicibacter ardleyensis]|uniref:tyrosine-protein phosphatase n=1 Tax=Glutamicibacter ardleyensis TaxID=225894 RepID=UPI003FD33E3A
MPTIVEASTAVPNLRQAPSTGLGRLYRSAALSALDASGIRELEALGVGTIVDLREPFESTARPDVLPVGAVYLQIPLYRGALPLATPIEQVYRGLLNDRGTEIAKAVSAIAVSLPSGVLLHCAAGKDRTGLVVALVLEVAEVPRKMILDDYARSAVDLPDSFRERVNQELRSVLDDGDELQAALHLHLQSPAAALAGALDLVAERFGSAACYLLAHGLAPAELEILRQELAGPSA